MKSKKLIISSAIAVVLLAGGTTFAIVSREDSKEKTPTTVSQEIVKEQKTDAEVTHEDIEEAQVAAPAPQEAQEVAVDNTSYIIEKLASVDALAMQEKFNTILYMQNTNYLKADKSFIDDVFNVAVNPDFSFIGRGRMIGQISSCVDTKQPVLCINATHQYLHFAGEPKLDDLR